MKNRLLYNLTEPGRKPASQDFARLVELQQKHSAATNALATLETEMSSAALRAALQYSEGYVVHQEQLSALDAEIRTLFDHHPEWREDGRKSVRTPYGEISQRTVSELEVVNAALTVTLIEARGKTEPRFDAAAHLHITKAPDLEALESLPDAELLALGIRRVQRQSVTVKPSKVAAARVVKAAAGQGQAKAKTETKTEATTKA